MAGFQFGNVQDLNSTITLGSFLAVIAFVVIFDFLIGLMEYFLSGSQLYNRMVQMIYKELMLMGLVSFTIIMVNASQSAAEIETESYKYWIEGVEFSHILLFYLTFFFVTHAFYLMRTSVICSESYRLMFVEPLSKIVTEVENLTVREKAYFNSQYLPFCSIRNRVEFQLILKLFNETYFLCEGFNFASYLSGCFDRYALKTINRSMFTWFVLMILSILNYTRIKVGFGYHNCVEPYIPYEEHRMLVGQAVPPIYESANNETSTMISAVCPKKNVGVFLFAAVALCFYTFMVLMVSRMYELRLFNKIGLKSPSDYLGFLKFVIENEVVDNVERVSSAQLKKEIDNVMDADEHHSDEEEEFREIGEFLVKTYSTVYYNIVNAYYEMKLFVLSYIDPERVNKLGTPVLLSIGGDDNNDDVNHGKRNLDDIDSSHTASLTTTAALREKEESCAKKKIINQLSMKGRLSQPKVTITTPTNTSTKDNILELLQSVQLQEVDSENKLIMSKPRPTIDFATVGVSNGNLTPGVQSHINPSNKLKKRATICVKHPSQKSTIEKFHQDQLKEIGSEQSKQEISNETKETANLTLFEYCYSIFFPCMRGNKVTTELHMHDTNRDTNTFVELFLFGKPILFFRAVELCIMFNCLYLAFWVTNFIKICSELEVAPVWKVLVQMFMAVPLLFVISAIGSIAQTSSMLIAVSELNLEVVHAVLIESEDVEILVNELRSKMLSRISTVATTDQKKLDVIHGLFNEIDQDGSGSIDKTEFRQLLKALKLTYSDQRFKRLYRAVDTDGDNYIGIHEIDSLLYPKKKTSSQPSCAPEQRPLTQVGGKLRSLSSIDDYSDTDSDEGGIEKKRWTKVNNDESEADAKVVDISNEEMQKPSGDDNV